MSKSVPCKFVNEQICLISTCQLVKQLKLFKNISASKVLKYLVHPSEIEHFCNKINKFELPITREKIHREVC